MPDVRWLLALLCVVIMASPAPFTTLEEVPLVVNREHRLGRDDMPEVLALPQVRLYREGREKDVYLIPEAAEALEALFAEAERNGYILYAVSGYRSYVTQASLYQNKVNQVGERRAMLVVAPPGASEHQTGLVMDINGTTTFSQGLVEAFGLSPEGLWVASQAHRFGFILRYGKEWTDITGYSWEPWHLRYVGVEYATAIYVADVPLEVYCGRLELERTLGKLPGWLRFWLVEEE